MEEYFTIHCGEDAVLRMYVQQLTEAMQHSEDAALRDRVTGNVKEWRVHAVVDVQILIGTAPAEALRRLYGKILSAEVRHVASLVRVEPF